MYHWNESQLYSRRSASRPFEEASYSCNERSHYSYSSGSKRQRLEDSSRNQKYTFVDSHNELQNSGGVRSSWGRQQSQECNKWVDQSRGMRSQANDRWANQYQENYRWGNQNQRNNEWGNQGYSRWKNDPCGNQFQGSKGWQPQGSISRGSHFQGRDARGAQSQPTKIFDQGNRVESRLVLHSETSDITVKVKPEKGYNDKSDWVDELTFKIKEEEEDNESGDKVNEKCFNGEGAEHEDNAELKNCHKTEITVEPSIVDAHKYYPLSEELMGKIFSDFVILSEVTCNYVVSLLGKCETNAYKILHHSFRRSGYHDLNEEDGFWKENKCMVRFCTFRYSNMMMARGMSAWGNRKDARVQASVEVLRKLFKFCYILQMKKEYYSSFGLRKLLKTKEEPGEFRVVPKEAYGTTRDAEKYIANFYQENVDSDCELIFQERSTLDLKELRSYAFNNGLATRSLADISYTGIAIFKNRSLQYWRDKLLASGKCESMKYTLIRPNENTNMLSDLTFVLGLAPSQNEKEVKEETFTGGKKIPSNMYGPEGVGPTIIVESNVQKGIPAATLSKMGGSGFKGSSRKR